MKRSHYLWLIAGVCSLICLTLVWVAVNKHAAAAILRSCPEGVSIVWEHNKERIDIETFSWLDVLLSRSLHPVKLRVKKPISVDQCMGISHSLKEFGGLREIAVTSGDPNLVTSLFQNLHGIDTLQFAYIANIRLTDSDIQALEQHPNIEELYLIGGDITGDAFPQLPHLRFLEIAYAPVSEQGFVKVLKLRSLNTLSVKSPAFAESTLLKLENISPSIQSISVLEASITKDSVPGILKSLQAKFPSILFDLSARGE